jgi:DNA-binding HxlR family transcriptional regulator
MQPVHRYRHFCLIARALEVVGERWGLLIVRDLLETDQRFSDLSRSCAGITPRQLTARLRQLEEAGIVQRHSKPGQREVWYRLSSRGRDLKPVVDGLLLWGMRHAPEPPLPDEPVRPYHVMNGTRLWLGVNRPAVKSSTVWSWRFPKEPYTLRFDGSVWSLSSGDDPQADVGIETTPRRWAEFVTVRHGSREADPALKLDGRPKRIREFKAAFGLTDEP